MIFLVGLEEIGMGLDWGRFLEGTVLGKILEDEGGLMMHDDGRPGEHCTIIWDWTYGRACWSGNGSSWVLVWHRVIGSGRLKCEEVMHVFLGFHEFLFTKSLLLGWVYCLLSYTVSYHA